jgi:hypothetical protein
LYSGGYSRITNLYTAIQLAALFLKYKTKTMKKILMLCVLFIDAFQTQAQILPTANLTIFSEDGQRFFLILNGERQNEQAQTNIRIEELPQPYYNCKIIFEDPSQKEISKNMLMLTDANGVPQDVTYKIKKDKSGKSVLRFFSFIPAEQNMVRPSNCTVYRFGVREPIFLAGGVRTQTTTTTIQTRDGVRNDGAQLNIDMPGAEIRLNVSDPDMRQSTTVRTQTTTMTTTTQDIPTNPDAVNDGSMGTCRGYSMSPGQFEDARKVISAENFDETRLDIAKQAITANCMNTNQIMQVCKLFSFEESKLDFAKFAYAHCSDPNNYFKLNGIFTFSSSKEELTNYIQSVR